MRAVAFERAADRVWAEMQRADGPFENEKIDGFLKLVFLDGAPLSETEYLVAEVWDFRIGMAREFRFACVSEDWPRLLFDAAKDGYFEYELSKA